MVERGESMILSGDIGGTNSRLALFGEDLRVRMEKIYPSRDYPGLDEVVRVFLRETGAKADRACFGVAGPVKEGKSKTTNLPWSLDEEQLSAELGIPRVRLINDLEASAHGIPSLAAEDQLVLHPGDPESRGNLALIAAGTGLGEAGLFWDGEEHQPFATEGGHASFSPRNEREWRLLAQLLTEFDTVSWERVVSGPGLFHIYRFLRDEAGGAEPEWLEKELREGEAPATIVRAALSAASPLCVETLDLFVELYGAEAGNLALKMMATGGLYIGGGVAPKILPRLRGPGFLEAFFDKGRMRPLMEAMPVRLILDDRIALKGAARFAARMKG
jgi:glucokinase